MPPKRRQQIKPRFSTLTDLMFDETETTSLDTDDSDIKQMQKLVICTICSNYYQDPRLLPCSHTFCLKCIEKTVKNTNFVCPLNDNTQIAQNNIKQLPVNLSMKSMIEFLFNASLLTDNNCKQQCNNCDKHEAIHWCEKCESYYCEACAEILHSNKALQSHTTIPSAEKMLSFCTDHSEEKLKYWCKQCEVLVCRDCLLFQHKDHVFSPLKDAATEVKTKFRDTVKEIDAVKQDLTTFLNTTKKMINEQHGFVQQQKQNVEQTFANLQRILDQRKQTILKQLEDNGLHSINTLDRHQKIIDQHLNLTTVQEFCLKKILDTSDAMQILRCKSTFSHNSKYFTEQLKMIDEGCIISKHTFVKDEKDIAQLTDVIGKLGTMKTEIQKVEKTGIVEKLLTFDISKHDGQVKSTEKHVNYARGYKFTLKQLLRLKAIEIKSDYIGQHVGFVINDTNAIIEKGTVYSNDSTMKSLTIPLECEIKNNYYLLVWAPSGNGSYAYKDGNSNPRVIDRNCSVESKYVHPITEVNVGSVVNVGDNIYSIDMVLKIEE